MVFFNCNACGEALKKNQVDKHCQRCRQCQVLSCVDCGKDFWGDDYKNHTKCMTEEEKYCGKSYVPKLNKGEAKQEEWTEKVQAAISKTSKNPQMSQLLESMKDYPNIPRKRGKFENFLKNSLRVRNTYLINQVWDLLMTAASQGKEETKPKADVPNKVDVENGEEKENTEGNTQEDEEQNGHKSKREKKEERRKKAHKKEKKDKPSKLENSEEIEEPVKRKGKKRKHEDENTEEPSIDAEDASVNAMKKKKKKKYLECDDLNMHAANGIVESACDVSLEEDTQTPKKKRKKVKFNWEEVIINILKSKGEISLKKLRKKVLNEFAAQDASNYNEENLQAKFGKKVSKIPQVKILKERVSLKKK